MEAQRALQLPVPPCWFRSLSGNVARASDFFSVVLAREVAFAGNTACIKSFTKAMHRLGILFGAALVLGAVAYGLGHFMNANGIWTADHSRIMAQEKVENQELKTRPPVNQ